MRSKSEARQLLIDYWMGHENDDMSTRHGRQLVEDIQYRKEWAEKVGLGFELPMSKLVLFGLHGLQNEENVNAVWMLRNSNCVWGERWDLNPRPSVPQLGSRDSSYLSSISYVWLHSGNLGNWGGLGDPCLPFAYQLPYALAVAIASFPVSSILIPSPLFARILVCIKGAREL